MGKKLPKGYMPPPDSRSFSVDDHLRATKEQHPKIPVGSLGVVTKVFYDINEIWISWSIPEWPYVKVTKGSPSNGYEKVAS